MKSLPSGLSFQSQETTDKTKPTAIKIIINKKLNNKNATLCAVLCTARAVSSTYAHNRVQRRTRCINPCRGSINQVTYPGVCLHHRPASELFRNAFRLLQQIRRYLSPAPWLASSRPDPPAAIQARIKTPFIKK